MSTVRAYCLRFLAPVRLGASARDAGDAAPDFPSDTLSAALVVAAADLYGEHVDGRLIGDLARDPPWVLSSLLPWVEIGGRILRFFPCPADRAIEGAGSRKTYRKIAYLSPTMLADSRLAPKLSRCGTLAAAESEVDGDFDAVIWHRRAARPSVTLDRVTGAPDLFHLEEVCMGMGDRVGVWVLVRTETEAEMKLVRVLLTHLSESGIGADRARGYGRFEILQPLNVSLDDSVPAGRMRLLLGYASPDNRLAGALQHRSARYSVIRREGVAHGARGGLGHLRKSLRLVGPGSLVPDCGPVVGRTQDLTPESFKEHAIWRDGRTLAWPIIGVSP